ncbi:MAG: hypothetical protein RI973_1341, partial [Bacteroidota bacterium]
IEKGIPKQRIEAAAARKQARIDRGEDEVVGVNTLAIAEETPLEILSVNNLAVRESQIRRLQELKAGRDAARVSAALSGLRRCAAGEAGNLLELAVEAARCRATLGEISEALEGVFGRYEPRVQPISGIYANEIKMDETFLRAKKLSDEFAQLAGRRPRIMIAKLGQDGHDRGARVIATGFADLGFDVDIGPLFQTPEEAARQAAENDVHILGISSLAAGHRTLVPQTIAALKEIGRADILVVVGGVIPRQDYEFLTQQGVSAVFGPGTKLPAAAESLLLVLMNSLSDS